MSPRKKGKRGDASLAHPSARAAPIPSPRRRRPSRALGLAIAGAAVAAALLLVGRRVVARPVVFPEPAERVAPSVSRADFVGAEACADCHAEQTAAWRRSTHGRAGGPPSRATVIAPFDGTPIRFADATVTPRIRTDGAYVFEVERRGEPLMSLRVDAVIGGGHMAGGGTQGFVTRRPDGTWRFLPFDYSRDLRAWFCNTDTRAGKGWQLVTADMPLGACGDWPPTRVLGDLPRFANCQGCHTSQIDVRFDAAASAYATRVTSFTINCESCHGPARRHVELARSGRLLGSADVGMAALALADKDASSRVCYQCHALKDRLRPGFLAGDSLERFYSLAFPLLGDAPLFPDGRVRTFAYQESQQFSDCYLNGGMRCTDCHDPHSQGYRDVNGVALTGRLNDGQCIGCHPSKAEQVERHARHRADSPGSRCVACHMPYLQQPQVGTVVRYGRSDHTIPVPRPAHDSAMGVANACASCHADASAGRLDAQVRRWYDPLKPVHPAVDAQLRGAHDVGAVLGAGSGHAFARFRGLARLFERWVDAPERPPDGSAIRGLREMTQDADADVRALALAALHFLDGDDRGTRRALADALRRAGSRDAGLRDRWSLALGWAGDRLSARGSLDAAALAYRRALEVSPDHPQLLLHLGNAERDAGRLPDAVAAYRRSLAADSAQSLTYVNLGIALAGAGDTAAAIAAWEAGARVDKFDPLPHFNLGNVRLLRGDGRQAIESYRMALALDPGIVPIYLNLARAYAAHGMVAEAKETVRAALHVNPGDESARALQAQLEALPTPRERPR